MSSARPDTGAHWSAMRLLALARSSAFCFVLVFYIAISINLCDRFSVVTEIRPRLKSHSDEDFSSWRREPRGVHARLCPSEQVFIGAALANGASWKPFLWGMKWNFLRAVLTATRTTI
jgi:hypothetical protein